MLKRALLPNGLRVLLCPMANTQAVTTLFLTRTGSKYETKDLNGISHLLEHLLFRGTKSWPRPSSISQELDRVGGFYNAFTDKEVLGIIIKVAVENFPLAANILTEMITAPLLKQSGIAKEKKVVIEEINMREDNSQLLILDLWEELLYGDQPAGWQTIGSKEKILAISRKNLLEHLRKYFVAENSIVIVAGNFKEADIEKKLRKIFSGLVRGKRGEKLPVKEKQEKPLKKQ